MTKKELLRILNNPKIPDNTKIFAYVYDGKTFAIASGEVEYAELKTRNGEVIESVTIYGKG